jgi:two-component system chemotaxis response regulator CheB
MRAPVRALVCDDSPFVCRLVSQYLAASPGIEVVGSACDAELALDLVRSRRPDVVTLDLTMKNAQGLKTLDRLMHECPTPVVVISGEDRNLGTVIQRAFALGAVDFVSKFTRDRRVEPSALRNRIVAGVRAAAQVRVVRSLPSRPSAAPRLRPLPADAPVADLPPAGVVVVGASTGGPEAVRNLLQAVDPDLAASFVVVQHMPRGVTRALVRHLDRQLAWRVREAEPGDLLEPGQVLVAPGGSHLLLGSELQVELQPGEESQPYCPSIDLAMRSAARVCGSRARGVVLSGMGCDGSAGLAEILEAGGLTFAQEPASCVVDSMPRCALEIGAAQSAGSPEHIGQLLSRRARR